MSLFKKKDKVVDLSERYHQQQEQLNDMRAEMAQEKVEVSNSNGAGIFNMFGGVGPITSSSQNEERPELDAEERKRRLSKRLLDMTNKIEDLNNQIYHLQQRIEVLERKNNSGY